MPIWGRKNHVHHSENLGGRAFIDIIFSLMHKKLAVIPGERTDQSSMQEEISRQGAQQVEKDSKVRFGHFLPYDRNTR